MLSAAHRHPLQAGLEVARIEVRWWNRRRLASVAALVATLVWAAFSLID